MRCSLVVAVALCALLCSASPAGAQVKAVKLCGREFLRAVVYTCGGSRWRRLLQDPESQTEGDQDSLEGAGRNVVTELTRRDMNNILTTVCCQVGCGKSDLRFLC
ncbi:insulin-like 5a [Gadus chalcogrammus]|uniref:insulin-like 5a n=1 Tax=Gadus chalcogrammus TaxID=1042646 RepID=UPI0024C4B1B2|nr:insulin-like 5a [Gadus chalcogrammus]XP_056459404.1 insulin-like 5a [Gadus chalcogrammus]